MNRFVAIFLFFFLSIQNVRAGEFLPFDGPRPLAVLVETNPWLMVMGSDTPSFVLYEDGQVIYRERSAEKSANKESRYLWKLMTSAQLQSLKVTLASFGPYPKGNNRINLTEFSDQPETKLYLNFDETKLVASIYGIRFATASREDGRSKTPFPAELGKLYAFLSSLQFTGATEWRPKYLEAIAWDYSHVVDASVVWPKQWPGLNSPTTIKRETMFSIFVPGIEINNVSAFLGTRKERGAIEIDGKNSRYRCAPRSPASRCGGTSCLNKEIDCRERKRSPRAPFLYRLNRCRFN